MNTPTSVMHLKVVLPTKILMKLDVLKLNAEAENGMFCLLPRHLDFVATLVPSLISLITFEDEEKFLAIDQGILVKQGDQVTVATPHAVQGVDLGMLKQTVEQQFRLIDEREKIARSVLAKLEVSTIRGFIKLGESI
ncbi:F0F1 ATP synthase subunit epsilon [Pseudanabaena galeata UHCC 0370]|uniref:ATP synthase epsilon chain n=1 Tax=Pseudanabaena galeata UHCC 0370 TaxID=3110310 RepID=A0ABU5TFK7_9CYAN|nr:F0F1 ATP synthase subunit epsilon [Pseudanabaena galeata]MEA5477085.1 F0F1 ATP synthase subunit epsilon [Pseudanabaena galeata UHCC 0370]